MDDQDPSSGLSCTMKTNAFALYLERAQDSHVLFTKDFDNNYFESNQQIFRANQEFNS